MSKQRTYAPKEHSPLASIEDWEDFVVVRYPEEGKPANSEKDRDAYRNYDHPARDSVREFYRLNHTYQTYDFVREKEAEFLKFDRSPTLLSYRVELHAQPAKTNAQHRHRYQQRPQRELPST